jgi:hypothetical protein
MKLKRLILLLPLILLSLPAKQKPAFSHIEAIIQIDQEIKAPGINQFWKNNSGFSLTYKTPFYYGNMLLGFHFFSHQSRLKENPDFQSYFLYAGWSYDLFTVSEFTVSPGIKFGNYLMNFKKTEGHEKFESELCFEYFCHLDYSISDLTKINIEVGREVVNTYKPLVFNIIKAGISLQIESPDWFKDFLE